MVSIYYREQFTASSQVVHKKDVKDFVQEGLTRKGYEEINFTCEGKQYHYRGGVQGKIRLKGLDFGYVTLDIVKK